MPVITVENLTKEFIQPKKKPGLKGAIKHLLKGEYITRTAVDNLNFSINEGEVVAYLGRNGAGKSTTIKMLTGVVVPTSGKLIVNGLVPYLDRMKNAENIGAVFGQRTQLWWDIPLRESFEVIKDIYRIPEPVYKRNIELFGDILGINDYIHNLPRKISLGQRMRADLAAALLHNPKILFLDEPTIGLDIAVKKKVREFIMSVNKEYKTTVILTTHDMGDIEELCSRLIIIDQAKKIYDGEMITATDKFAQFRTINFKVSDLITESIRILVSSDLIINSYAEDNISVSFNRFEYTAGDIISQISKIANIIDLTIIEPSIESVIQKVYGGEITL